MFIQKKMLYFYSRRNLIHVCKILHNCFQNHNLTYSTSKNDFAAKYVSSVVESRKYEKWEENQRVLFKTPQENDFKMILPPPNVTGTLHLGHALTLTIQDILVRWKKMCGVNTVWVPGIDHAGIATQVVVEKKLWKERKLTRHQIGRENFEKEIVKWKEEKAEVIRRQIKMMGALVDWPQEFFTMDEMQERAVTEAFIRLFEKGLVYRRVHLVNWSCVLQSAISDIEVEYLDVSKRTEVIVPGYDKPVQFGTIIKFAYNIVDSNEEVIVCTTRPETILGDTAIAVHPNDDRYVHLRGKFVQHPFRNIQIPIICDEFVDRSFGSGVVKVTPAHDPVDFEVGKRHNLEIIDVIDESGKIVLNEYVGIKRFDARKILLNQLESMGLLRGVDDHAMKVPICSRSKDVIEYLVKPQWFIDCKRMAERAVLKVRNGALRIEPSDFEKKWFQWLENVHDWCVSRQLWWGHRIPLYECYTNEEDKIWVAAENLDNATQKAALNFKNSKNIIVRQEDDVLDTWFSSALLPFSIFGWPQTNFYPLSLMETGHDILFFWVARMVMLGLELTNRLPFDKILLHGIICDAHGRKMSKSLGNVIAPEHIINGVSLQDLLSQTQNSITSADESKRAIRAQEKSFPKGIPRCGTDALRFTLCSHNIKNHFINFDINECHTNSLFCNKIWQACRFTNIYNNKLNESNTITDFKPSVADNWILSRISLMISEVNKSLERYDFHIATSAIKQFLYNDFCDVYVELTKPALNNDRTKAENHLTTLITCLEHSLRCLAPFMPFLAEELYEKMHHLTKKYDNVFETPYPVKLSYRNEPLEKQIRVVLEAVTVIRRLYKLYNIKTPIKTYIITTEQIFSDHRDIIKDLTNAELVVDSALSYSGATVFDTISKYGVVHVELSSELMKNVDSVNVRLGKKVSKLVQKIDKLQKTLSEESYKINAPVKVQKAHLKQLESLEEELVRLKRSINVQSN